MMSKKGLTDNQKVTVAGLLAYVVGPVHDMALSGAFSTLVDQILTPDNLALIAQADPKRAAIIAAGLYVYKLLKKKEGTDGN